TGVTTYCLHPGAVHTGLGRHLGSSVGSFVGRLYEATSKRFFKSALMGAQTTIHCSVEERLAFESGYYYCDLSVINPSSTAQDDDLARRLWADSESFVSNYL
ncbi:retinol dehydrogenase 13, partial [Caerostris darwini]